MKRKVLIGLIVLMVLSWTSFVLSEGSSSELSLNNGVYFVQERVYVAKKGDYLQWIADGFKVKLQDLIKLNHWSERDHNKLWPGERLKIPPGAKIPLWVKIIRPQAKIETEPSQEKTASDSRLVNSLIVVAMVIFAVIIVAAFIRRRNNNKEEETTTGTSDDPNEKITCTACGEKIMNKNLNRHIRKRCPGRDTSSATATM